jgi:fibronectin-binding autotransporter adhesin
MAYSAVPSRRLILATGIAALLTLTGKSAAQSLHWDPGVDGDGAVGGSGVWNLTNTFWSPLPLDAVAADNIAWPNTNTAIGIFGGTAGVVTINTGAGVTANGLVFNTSGYQISSNVAADVLTFAGAAPSITLNGGSTARINSVIAGSAGLTISGSGNLTLASANTLTGQMIIAPGAYVGITNAGALGPAGGGNETVVQAGGTLNIGGQFINNNPAPATPGKEIRIAGTGVGGIGALINTFTGGNNTLAKVVLTADATISAGGNNPSSFAAGGNLVTSSGGRIDIRTSAAPTAGQKHLDLGGFTLTKTGGHLLALVNADVSDGNIIVNEGQLNFEAGTLVQGTGTITVNQNGKLGFWSIANGANITRSIVVNGGTIGDPTSTGAAQTINAPIQFTGANNPNFTAISTANRTTLAGVISQSAFTGTSLDKRGLGVLGLNNPANSFTAPVTVYSGTLGADYTTLLSGGVPPGAPVTSTDTPLGTNSTITLAGGTLAIRANMASDNTQQVFDMQRAIVVDRAPGGMTFDRITSTGTDKHVKITSLTMAPASAENQYSIGQNQLTFSQGNTHRLEIPLMTMNSDSVLAAGDHTFSGDILSANRNSLMRTGGNTTQFIAPGNHQFNAFFVAGGNLRVGSGFGTGVTNDTVTVGTGTVYVAPGSLANWRRQTNIAAGQVIDATISQQLTLPVVNFEQATAIPQGLRALGSGVYGIGSSTYADLDVSKLGDGSWRIGSNITGGGNGTITGFIAPGAGDIVRMGGGGTVTASGTNAITGNAALEVGAQLLNNGQPTNGTGTVILTGANDHSGGTTVNRGSTLVFRNTSLGSGAVTVGGTIIAESAGNAGPHGTFIGAGPVTLLGGSTIRFVNDAITDAATPTPDRWGDATPLGLTAGTLEMRARNIVGASDTIEAVGPLSFAGGNVISLQRLQTNTSGHNVQLTAESLNRVNQGTIELARNTGTGAGYGVGQRLVITTGAPAVTNGMVAPYFVAQNNGPTDFLTYGANGFTPITYDNTITTGTYTAGALNFDPVAGTGGKVAVTTTDLTLADNPVMYALKSERSIIVSGANNTVTLRSGGLNLRNLTDNTTVTINPAVTANDGTNNIELLVNTVGGGTGRNYLIGGVITSANLTKFGAGNLILTNAANAITGTAAINAGTLELRVATAATASPAGTANLRLQGGQLNVRGAAGNYTLTNGLTVAQNIVTATLDSNRTDASSTGTVSFNPSVAGPGLVLEGAPGTQGQTLNVAGANYGITFGTNAQNSLAGNVTINTAINLQLNNGPTITGTNPVITKSGGGNWIVGAVAGSPSVANGTQVHLNDGTLELRSVVGFGTSATTSLHLNRGTLNLRRDSAGTYGTTGSATGYPVFVNGSATISTDRVGGTNTNFVERLGKLTVRTNGTLTLNAGNGIYPEFAGAEIQGAAFIASNVGPGGLDSAARFQSGFDVSGGALVKLGGGHLHLMNPNSTYDGGTYIQQGFVRARATNALGTGSVYLNPGAILDLDSSTNLGATQPLIVRSNGAFMPMISVNVNNLAHPTANVDTSNAPVGIVGLSNGTGGSYDATIDLSALYGGRWSLGGVPSGVYDPVFTGASIVAGSNNLYRLGGGGTSFAMGTDSARAALTNVLTGPNDVRLGFDSGNILPINGGNFQFAIAGTNNYTGGETVIHRGMVVRLMSNNNGTQSGLSNSAVDVFGVLSLAGAASLDSGAANVNAVTFHPGSALFLDNNNGAANGAGAFAAANNLNRWNDTTPINLNGAMLNLIGNNNNPSSETVGDVTYSRGARVRAQLTGTGTATLTLNNLLGAGPGNTLLIATSGAGTLGAGDKIIVANNPPVSTNGMVTPSIINQSDATFVTHGANGFANITYDKTVNATYTPGSLLATDKVDVVTAALNLADNPTVYALRTSQSINNSGPFNQITIRSGGLIATAGTISPNLVFNDGNANIEARIYNSGTVTINGAITANGITKTGNANLTIAVPQTDYASGWTVNSGTLQINDPQGLGQSVPGNGVTLNGALTTGGQASQAFGQTQLILTRNNDSPELLTFSGGPITVVNEGTLRLAAGDNRNIQSPPVILDSSSAGSAVGFTFDVPNNRFRGIIPNLTLNDNAVIRVFDSGSQGDTGRVTTGALSALTGTGKSLTKIGNRTLELSGDNSTTFTGGSITVSQGTIRVRHNGSLGGAGTAVTVERNATLEIDTPAFAPNATITQQAGSIERWNREDVRGATYNLPAGVNLQLNTNLLAARTIGLNGGSIEGFLWTDHVAPAVERTVGSAVTVNLLANSFVGQNIVQGQGYDAGRQPTVGQPFGNNNTGAFLRIDGNITGNFDLTKTGLDTVTIAGTANTYRNTIVELGILRSGTPNALPTNQTLSTRTGGVFDLNGNNQTVAGLGSLTSGPALEGSGVGSAGSITNSGTTDNTLTVNNTAGYTYNGKVEGNVALTKSGAGTLLLNGANTYVGPTIVDSGTLAIDGAIAGTPSIQVKSGATLDVSGVTGSFLLSPEQLLTGSGSVVGSVSIDGVIAPGDTTGTLTLTAPATFNAGSELRLEIDSAASFDKLAASGVSLTSPVNLTIDLGYVPVPGTPFLIADNTGALATSGQFSMAGAGVLNEGATFFVAGQGFNITYQGGTGNDVVITAIPEPSVAIAILGAAGVLLGVRRRRAISAR